MKDGFFGFRTIYGANGEHATPYLTQAWIGRLRLHIFLRGDADPDCHDHPWDFWTFPLTSYVEEVASIHRAKKHWFSLPPDRALVKALALHHRPAEYTHRVLGRYDATATAEVGLGAFATGEPAPGPQVRPGRIVTIVWRGRQRRNWGFLKSRAGKWCWTPWKDYVYRGGKHAPCEPHGDAQ